MRAIVAIQLLFSLCDKKVNEKDPVSIKKRGPATALAGIEPATSSLTVSYSTAELQSN